MRLPEPPKGAQAAIRTIRLLKAFTADEAELTLGELIERTGLNKTTAHRLLAALESEAFIEKGSGRGRYRLGPGTVALGVQAQSSNRLRIRARPALEHLARQSRETATLEVLLGDELMTLDEVGGGRVVSASGYVGRRWPAHATSSGKAILARLRSDYVNLVEPFTRFTDRTIVDMESLSRELRRTRKLGYAVAANELEDGYSEVSVSIAGQGAVRAAISIGGPSTRLTRERRAELGLALIREVASLEREHA